MNVWDGLTQRKPRKDTVGAPDEADFVEMRDQIIATQEALNEVAATPLDAVPSPTGGATEAAEARAAIDLIIARLVAKGLIEAEE